MGEVGLGEEGGVRGRGGRNGKEKRSSTDKGAAETEGGERGLLFFGGFQPEVTHGGASEAERVRVRVGRGRVETRPPLLDRERANGGSFHESLCYVTNTSFEEREPLCNKALFRRYRRWLSPYSRVASLSRLSILSNPSGSSSR